MRYINQVNEKAKFFKALGEPNRLKIVDYLLKKGSCSCICELSNLLEKDHSVIFRHIMTLKEAGIVNTKKNYKSLFCCIKDHEKIKKILEVKR